MDCIYQIIEKLTCLATFFKPESYNICNCRCCNNKIILIKKSFLKLLTKLKTNEDNYFCYYCNWYFYNGNYF